MAVYRIVGPLGEAGLVYYGSTEDVGQRWSSHKSKYRSGCPGYTSKRVFDEYGVDACRIEVVEEVKEDFIERERWWIENNECVNERVPGRSQAEVKSRRQLHNETHRDQYAAYRMANRAKNIEYQKTYREANREKLRVKDAERWAAKKVSQ